MQSEEDMPEEVARLRQLMKEHLLHIAPENIAATPKIKRRKKIELNRHTCKLTLFYNLAT